MSIQPEHLPLHRPSRLVDSGFGIDVHPTSLNSKERELHHKVLTTAVGDFSVRRLMQEFIKKNDKPTLEHGFRVASLATAGGVRYGLPERDLVTGAIGDILHDYGRIEGVIRDAVSSPFSFADRPDLALIGCDHPLVGGRKLRTRGVNPNIVMVIEGHHGKQVDAYGLLGPYEGFKEEDGYIPDMDAVIGFTALADPTDALSVDPVISNRMYLMNQEISPERAISVARTVKVSEQQSQAYFEAVDLRAA